MPGTRVTETVKDFDSVFYGKKLRFNAHEIHICTWMYDEGCPENPEEDDRLARERIEEGWRSAPI